MYKECEDLFPAATFIDLPTWTCIANTQEKTPDRIHVNQRAVHTEWRIAGRIVHGAVEATMKSYQKVGQFAVFGLVFILFLAVIHPFLIPIILGLLISLVYRPMYLWIIARVKGRKHLASSVSTLIVILCVLLPLVLIAIFVAKDVANLTKTIGSITESSNPTVQQVMKIPALANLYRAVNRVHPMTPEEFSNSVRSGMVQLSTAGKNVLRELATSIARKVIALVFFLIAFYFGLVDGASFAKFLKDNSPFSNRDTNQLFTVIHKICNAVVLGALLAGTVQGIIVGTAYWILGIPQPLLFGVLTGIFSFVPLVGCAPTCIGGILYLLAAGTPVKALFMLLVFLMAGVSDNIVKPWVLKDRTEIHPLLGLVSVLGGLRLFGFAGLFLGPVITALSVVLIQLLRHRVNNPTSSETIIPSNPA